MQTNLNRYVAYFRRLAMSHSDIRHNPATEELDAAAPDKRFYKWDDMEIVSALRTQITFPALIIDLYERNLNAESEFDIRQPATGAFTVLMDARPGNVPEMEAAYARTEKIVNELLQQIWADHYQPVRNQCKAPFKEFYFDKLNITDVGPLFENHYGWRVEFMFLFQKTVNISTAPATGVFDDITILGNNDEWLGYYTSFLGWKTNS